MYLESKSNIITGNDTSPTILEHCHFPVVYSDLTAIRESLVRLADIIQSLEKKSTKQLWKPI